MADTKLNITVEELARWINAHPNRPIDWTAKDFLFCAYRMLAAVDQDGGRELAEMVVRLQRFIPVCGVDSSEVGRDWCIRVIPLIARAREILAKEGK